MPDMHLHILPEPISIEARRRPAWTRRLAFGVTIILSTIVALISYRYLFGFPPVPPGIASNGYRHWWLPVHAGFAATALLIGAVQFSGALRRRRPAVHRIVGRIYVVSCLLAAAAGLVLAIGSSAGPIATAGFGCLAIAWMITNVLGWQAARARDFTAHRRWMMRSWALTLAAVTLRLYLVMAEIVGLPDLPAYRAISFLCWMPNLVVAEWLVRRRLGGDQVGARIA